MYIGLVAHTVYLSELGHTLAHVLFFILNLGHLEKLIASDMELSPASLKACVQYCPGLKLLDGVNDLTTDEAVEMAKLYGRCSHSPVLLIRSNMPGLWRSQQVREVREEIKQGTLGHRGRLVIDCRLHKRGLIDEEIEEENKDIYVDFDDEEDEDEDSYDYYDDVDD